MKPEELRKEIGQALSMKPAWLRKGQFIFNYIDFEYGVARIVQYEDNVDCFYDDSKIDEFIECCAKRIKYND